MANRTMTLTMVALAMAVLAVTAQDTKIQLKNLPAGVQKAVHAEEAKGAKIVGLSSEVENGKTVYEVETKVNGRARDLILDATGAILVAEQEVGIETVPAAVKAAFESRGKVLIVETVTKGKRITYEAQVEKNGKKVAVEVDENGKPVKA